ncbi:MAG: hypothetical protein KJ060_20150, partial [Candidatus Hydrogenedentes bacterium]|nr:hypothetical protein [Candidatus Hydrogenedentota bacterium]
TPTFPHTVIPAFAGMTVWGGGVVTAVVWSAQLAHDGLHATGVGTTIRAKRLRAGFVSRRR